MVESDGARGSSGLDLERLRRFVVLAEERNFGRAAARLHMTQPPLSRAIRQLEADLGTLLLHRSPAGVTLTAAGIALHTEARALLAHAEHARARVAAAAGRATFTIGILADSVDAAGTDLASEFRARHPDVEVRIREAELTDPTTGLRAGLVDVALTRAPFDRTGISSRMLRTERMGAVLRDDDPLAGRDSLRLGDLDDREWFQLPAGTDRLWRAYWNGSKLGSPLRNGPAVRTVRECTQATLWNGTVGLAPLGHAMPAGLTTVPLVDMPPSRLIVAWNKADPNPLIRSLTQIAVALHAPRVRR